MMYVRSNLSNKQDRKKKFTHVGTTGHSKGYEPTFGTPSSSDILTEKEDSKSGSTIKVILFSLALGALGLIYLNHVFSTQVELEQVMQLQREYERARRVNADRKFTYDRMIGPAEVYERAKRLGLIDGGPVNGTVKVKLD